MKNNRKKYLALLLAVVISLSAVISVPLIMSASAETGYTDANDVQYVTVSGKIANWGTRNEDCRFLSKYAVEFYTGSYSFSTLSQKAGGTSQSNADSSQLYSALAGLMKSRHTHTTSYDETKSLYKYTDCSENDTAHIVSFYSGKQLSSTWDGGKTWNREHTWPNSKGLNGSDENDIMMLRPTWVSENSSRGNDAYGESSGYFYPGDDVKGDCARIVLYTYTRWGNTGKMWGKSGVIENLDVLLKWMVEDPVDTWEMGRNDAVQSITGTRNVFIDYPEYAFLLFGRSVPEDFGSPSNGKANADPVVPSTGTTATEAPDIPVAPSGDTATYTFSDYQAGSQYAKNESHVLDSVMTVTTDDAHFTSEIRLYDNQNNHGTAIFASTRAIESLSLKAGYKAATLKVAGSVDGVNFTPIKDVSVTSAYADYSVAVNVPNCKFIKIEADGAQIRVKSVTMNYAASSVESTTAPVDNTTVPVETPTAPVDTTTVPVETPTAPVDTTTVPVDTTTVPVETPTTPVDTTTVPVETPTTPVDTTTVPVETPTAPVDTTTVPVETPTTPVDTTSASTDDTTASSDSDATTAEPVITTTTGQLLNTDTPTETEDFTIPSITTPNYGKTSDCGSFVGSGLVLIVSVLSLAAVVVIKKK